MIKQGKTVGQTLDLHALRKRMEQWAKELGFAALGVASLDLAEEEKRLNDWLSRGYHGEMAYMAAHGTKRTRPAELEPATKSVITVLMPYLPASVFQAGSAWCMREYARNTDPNEAVISLYARGRDYHRVVRDRLAALARKMQEETGEFFWRAFSDSAPVAEVALACSASLGWRGRHTLTVSKDAGTFFFLGELYTSLEFEPDKPAVNRCGRCRRCMTFCPTQAIQADGLLDARKCISYLTIEYRGDIDVSLWEGIGNRVCGCDVCQLVCPFNRFARQAGVPDFDVRNGFDGCTVEDLWSWTREDFEQKTLGMAIRRIGYERFRRNLVIAMSNKIVKADQDEAERLLMLLSDALGLDGEQVDRHIRAALSRREGAGGDDTGLSCGMSLSAGKSCTPSQTSATGLVDAPEGDVAAGEGNKVPKEQGQDTKGGGRA